MAYQLPVLLVSDGLHRHQDFDAFEAGLLKMVQLRLVTVENHTKLLKTTTKKPQANQTKNLLATSFYLVLLHFHQENMTRPY